MPTNHDETLQDRYARELAAMDPKTPMVKVMASNWQEDSLAPTWQQLQQAVAEHDALEQRNEALMQENASLHLAIFERGGIESVHEWHRRACPEPDARALDVQMGCHFEELAEFVSCLAFRARGAAMALDGEVTELWRQLKLTAERLKSGEMSATIIDRRGALDGLADGIVTGVGVGYRARMDITEALECVDASNWSKFVDGQPQFDGNGKVTKGPNYQAPDLTGLFELEGAK